MSLLANFDGVIRPRFIETGTNTGNTLENARHLFDECISIEQGEAYYRSASERFKDVPNIKLFHGDSPEILKQVIDPDILTAFWLDAHYHENSDTLGPSGQCPLVAELRVIAAAPWRIKPIILIDDAHMFDGSIPHPGSHSPFWISNESNHTSYNRTHWPKIEEIESILDGYKRSMRSDRPGEEAFILQYE